MLSSEIKLQERSLNLFEMWAWDRPYHRDWLQENQWRSVLVRSSAVVLTAKLQLRAHTTVDVQASFSFLLLLIFEKKAQTCCVFLFSKRIPVVVGVSGKITQRI